MFPESELVQEIVEELVEERAQKRLAEAEERLREQVEERLREQVEERLREREGAARTEAKLEAKIEAILVVLEERFGTLPENVAIRLRHVQDEARLTSLARTAARCRDVAAFEAELADGDGRPVDRN
jgi:cytidylate kinase